ncbi:hypothetical protein [Mucilaginibacter segetis]|uniref:Uncharacterized protein n=1 Tax=Mucilaginibacter segetis TaxID=2793071 RepID=A0A934UNW8_9SPHI|nr:hypothetical protein [Mucilaginibacter segetis]MBK0380362.1 hypothetical protein [Mucilaginibacter segetis]
MTKPANSHNKPSPADTPTDRPNDEGHKSVVKKEDKIYKADEPHTGDIAKKHEKEEQPVQPVKHAPSKDQPKQSEDKRRLESK